MIRMFGFVGAARVKQRLTSYTVSLATGALFCMVQASLSRHWHGLASVRPYAPEVQLAGIVFLSVATREIRVRDKEFLSTTGTSRVEAP